MNINAEEGLPPGLVQIYPSLSSDLLDEGLAALITSRMRMKMDSREGSELLAAAMSQMICEARKDARAANVTAADLVAQVVTILEKTATMFPEAVCRPEPKTSCFLSLTSAGLTTFEALLLAARGRGT